MQQINDIFRSNALINSLTEAFRCRLQQLNTKVTHTQSDSFTHSMPLCDYIQMCLSVQIFSASSPFAHTDSAQALSSLLDYLLPVGMYLYGLACWIIKPLLLPRLGVAHLFMTPVMAVIVTVEITCQEDQNQGVPLLTRADRGDKE